jgi:hypothetical protein
MSEFKLDQQRIDDFVDTEGTPLQALWARVHAQAAELDPEAAAYDDAIRKLNSNHKHGIVDSSQKIIWITSMKVPGRSIRSGRVFCASPLLAAQSIVGGTHRKSTEEEIESWKAEQAQRKIDMRALEALKNPPAPTPEFHFSLPAEAIQGIRESAPATGQGKSHGGAGRTTTATE